jgi:hypothetical protein
MTGLGDDYPGLRNPLGTDPVTQTGDRESQNVKAGTYVSN